VDAKALTNLVEVEHPLVHQQIFRRANPARGRTV
jgi:hypothetical protein